MGKSDQPQPTTGGRAEMEQVGGQRWNRLEIELSRLRPTERVPGWYAERVVCRAIFRLTESQESALHKAMRVELHLHPFARKKRSY